MLHRAQPLLILAVGVAAVIALKATRPAPEPATPKERVWRVEVAEITPGEHHPTLALFGRVEAPDRIRASSPVAGRLLEVHVRDGELVASGQLLARIDPRDLLPRLQRAEADLDKERLKLAHDTDALEQERKILALAKAAVERADKVQSKNLASISSVDEAREQYARAQLAVTLREQSIAEHPARLASLEAALTEAQRDAARGEMTAPFDGRVGTVEAAAGDPVKANEPILTLYPLDGLYVRAKIPGAYSEELREALASGDQLVAKGTYAGQGISARLERIAGEADARGVDALLKLAPDAKAPLGAFMNVQLQRPSVPSSVALPFGALHGGDRLFVVADGRLRGVQVERLGELETVDSSEGRVLVRAPELRPGDLVMTTHLPHAIETLKVEIVR